MPNVLPQLAYSNPSPSIVSSLKKQKKKLWTGSSEKTGKHWQCFFYCLFCLFWNIRDLPLKRKSPLFSHNEFLPVFLEVNWILKYCDLIFCWNILCSSSSSRLPSLGSVELACCCHNIILLYLYILNRENRPSYYH